MTENNKYEALIKWLATDNMAQAPDNTDAWIDKYMKERYPELNTPSGDWGLHRLLDRAFTAGYIHYQDRKDGDKIHRWYSASSKGVMYADELIKRENLFKGAMSENSRLSADTILDMVLYWFALNPKDYKGGLIVARTKVPAEAVGSNIVEFYFKELNNIDFVIDLDFILDQLAIDGYLYKHNDEGWRPTYSITFKGKKFMQHGGYAKAYEKEARQKKTQTLKDFLLIGGAWVASIAGTGLLYFEYVKLNHHNPYGLSFWKIVVSLSILLMPILIWWIMPKRK